MAPNGFLHVSLLPNHTPKLYLPLDAKYNLDEAPVLSIEDRRSIGAKLNMLKPAFGLDEIKNAGYTIEEMKEACTVVELKEAGEGWDVARARVCVWLHALPSSLPTHTR